MNRIRLALLIAIAAIAWHQFNADDAPPAAESPGIVDKRRAPSADSSWHSGQQVRGAGEVIRILADDNDGSRHQRFILRLPSGRTLLIAHNIDLAPRVAFLRVGDRVSFNGEYEPNDRGGVVHWTHHDPQGRHEAGWVEHKGRRYQ